jgi:ABC-type branched-subunit amino acid transport system permease subunit
MRGGEGTASWGERLSWLRSRAFIFKFLLVVVLIVWPLLYQSGYAMRIMTTVWALHHGHRGRGHHLGQAGQLSFGHSAFYGMGPTPPLC